MYYPNPADGKIMSERVHVFNRRFRRYGMTNTNQELFDTLKSQIMEHAYYVPQVRYGLLEEDASEFILYLVDKIQTIVTSYNDEANDFYLYLGPVLENRVRTFYRNRRNSEKKEQSAVAAQVPLEIRSFPINHPGYSVSDDSSSANTDLNIAKKIRFVTQFSRPMQKRMFVFLLSVAPYLPLNIVNDVCTAIGFDYDKTLQLSDYLASTCPEISKNLDYLITRRNYYYRYSLELENELSIKKFSEDSDAANSYRTKLKKSKEHLEEKNAQINAFTTRVSYSILSDVLHIPRGTVACSIYYTKNLYNWLLDPTFSIPDVDILGVGKNITTPILNGTWKRKVKKSIEVLDPYKIFNISTDTALNK